jgi:branched-subunit amino acid transport protein
VTGAFWAIVLLGGMAVTYTERLSFLVLIGHERVPPGVRRGLRFVAPSVLAALILPELLLTDGHLPASLLEPRLIAGLLAAAVTWRFRNTWLTIAVGMLSLWLAGHLQPG